MKNLLCVLVMVLFVMVPAVAFAQGAGDGETVYDFEDEDLTGGLMRPDGEQITGDQGRRTSSLINIRQDFIPEMLKSVETL
jgi:hypothetical protein